MEAATYLVIADIKHFKVYHTWHVGQFLNFIHADVELSQRSTRSQILNFSDEVVRKVESI